MKKETQINNDTAAPEAAESVAVADRNAPSAQDRGRLNTALRKLNLLQRLFGDRGNARASALLQAALRPTGKNRGYKKRPALVDPNSKPESYRARRLRLIETSQRQGVEIAAARRIAYVQRRTIRWRGVVEKNFGPMLAGAFASVGLDHYELPLNQSERDRCGGFDGADPALLAAFRAVCART